MATVEQTKLLNNIPANTTRPSNVGGKTCGGSTLERKTANCCIIHGNMGRNAWACSETSKDDCGSRRDGSTARVKNRAASHFVRGASQNCHRLGATREFETDGMAQSIEASWLVVSVSQEWPFKQKQLLASFSRISNLSTPSPGLCSGMK